MIFELHSSIHIASHTKSHKMSTVTAKVSMTRLEKRRNAFPVECKFENYPYDKEGNASETPQNFTTVFDSAPKLAQWTNGQFGSHITLNEAANVGKGRCFCWTLDTDVKDRYMSLSFLEGTNRVPGECLSRSLFVDVGDATAATAAEETIKTPTRLIFDNTKEANRSFSETRALDMESGRTYKLLIPLFDGKSIPYQPVLLANGVCSMKPSQARLIIAALEIERDAKTGARKVRSELPVMSTWAETIENLRKKGTRVHISHMSRD